MSERVPLRRRRIFVWSAVFGYTGLAFTLARNVLLVPLYLHYIDLGEYGAWLATGGALAQLLVTDFGLTGVITQRIAARAGGGDLAAIRALVAAGLANALVLALGLSAVSSLAVLWLPATQGLAAAQVGRVFDCFLIAVAANGCGVLASAALAVVRGAQRPVVAGSVALVADWASVGVTLACLFAGMGLYGLAYGLLTRSIVSALGGLVAVKVLFHQVQGSWLPRWCESLAMWRDAARFFVTSIAMRLQTQANVLLVGIILGPHAAAIYGLTVRAHETVHIVMGQLNSAVGPVLAHLAGAGNLERLNGVIRRLLPLVAALAAVAAGCVVVLNRSFMGLWVGADAFGGLPLTALMGVALWITSIAYLGYEALLARGEFAVIARAFALGSALHIAVLLTVLFLFGAWAAPLALCASSLCWGTLLWRRVARDTHAAEVSWPALCGEVALIGGAGCIAAAGLLALLPPATAWPVLLAEATLCVLVIAALLLGVRPALLKLFSTEVGSTLRSMRAA
jgi:O-antigen/teichoic acid export membrane protein